MKQNNTNKNIIIMGRSEIAGKMVPTEHGQFDSIRDAEVFAKDFFKSLSWVVAEEVTRQRDNETKTEYNFVTKVQNPRRNYEE